MECKEEQKKQQKILRNKKAFIHDQKVEKRGILRRASTVTYVFDEVDMCRRAEERIEVG